MRKLVYLAKKVFKKANCYIDNSSKPEENERFDLSIIVPLYNSEKFIDACVRGLLCQKTQYKFEVILVNDGSKDHTLALAKEYQNQNKIRLW